MIQPDDTLQTSLAALERGVPLDKILADLPPENRNLAPLISLSAAARDLPHPQMDLTAARAQQARVVASAHRRQRRFALPALPQWRRSSMALAGGLALFVLLAAVVLGINLFTAG